MNFQNRIIDTRARNYTKHCVLHHARVATRTFSVMHLIADARRSLSASTRSVLRARN
ncbi:hypothetical protein [Helicobacter felis]|uniref:hypothetical protein n=1 Tax=Helicobacter felis TaxID=214 RepID=UPI001315456F|nr:hypothetical protein [Helicobacter felis]